MSQALAGLVVLDLTTEFWSALGTALLGDFGAEVIRLSDPSGRVKAIGDGGPDENASDEERCARRARFELANRNKLALSADVADARGREILEGLILQADVFVTDWPSESRWSYATASALKADIIYAYASGFGPKGPDRDLPALDELASARAGMMPILPQPGQPPVFSGAGQLYTTVMLAFGVLTALHHREETGEGQEVDVSLFAGSMYGASLDLQAFLAMGGERFLHPVDRLDAGNPMSGTMYQSQDGRWVTLTMPDTDRWWPGFSEIVDIDPSDPRFDSHAKRCDENRLELMQVLEERFGRHSGDHWRRQFAERQLSADVIEEYSYPASDEQARRNRYVLDVEHPHLGRTKTLGFPIFMSESPARLQRAAPSVGQHTAQILHERLGYSEDRIRELTESGVIA